MLRILIISLMICAFILPAHAQDEVTTKSGKAARHYKKALQYYDAHMDIQAIEELESAISADRKFIEAYLVLSEIYHDNQNFMKEVEVLKIAISIDPHFFPASFYNLGRALLLTGKYEEAKTNFRMFLDTGAKPELRQKSEEKIRQCDFAMNAMKHPVPFEPKSLGQNVNTQWDDYMPSLTADEQTLIFTVDVPIPGAPKEKLNDTHQEDIYISQKVNGVWTKSHPIGEPLNTPGNEGATCISPDGQSMVLTACNRKGGYGSCDLYYSFRRGRKWSDPVNMGQPVNSNEWDSQPSISSDGKTMYFASARKGGKGNMDIWMTRQGDDGKWGNPVNLGDSINTGEDEMSPFIHPDNQTLYFASNGWMGMGNFDLFYSRRKPDGTWSRPVNMGYPINTYQEESYMVVNAKGSTAYFSTERPGSRGKDIYTFELYELARPVLTTYVKGTVFDSVENKPIQAKIQLIDLEKNKTVAELNTDPETGEFLVCLPIDKNYLLNISSEDHLFYSDHFSLKNLVDPSKYFLVKVTLKPIQVGEKVVLKNIFFDTGKYDLKPESQSELNKLVDFMVRNKSIHVEIGGHTDNVGTDEHNQSLSENRAKAVFDYLIQHNIEQARLSYKGYGRTMPVATNDTDEGRAQNRRTEFKIIDK